MKALLFPMALLAALPVHAQSEVLSADQAEARLRGCLLAGATSAPRTDLRTAVVATRVFCRPQIARVEAQRRDAATDGLTGSEARAASDRAIRALNDEIARAIANFTGLSTL